MKVNEQTFQKTNCSLSLISEGTNLLHFCTKFCLKTRSPRKIEEEGEQESEKGGEGKEGETTRSYPVGSSCLSK